MRFLSQAIAQKLYLDSAPQLPITVETLREIRDIRDELTKRTDKILLFLFTTLTIIAFFQFDVVKEAKLFGTTIEDKQAFIFAGFLIGNALYVANTGSFLKVFLLEFYLFYIVTDPNFKGSRVTSAVIYSYPANVLAALKFNKTLTNASIFARYVFAFSRVYSRYALLVIYSAFYFFVLISFLSSLCASTPDDPNYSTYQMYFWVILTMNIFSVFTSCAIFLPARIGATRAREGRLAEKDRHRSKFSAEEERGSQIG